MRLHQRLINNELIEELRLSKQVRYLFPPSGSNIEIEPKGTHHSFRRFNVGNATIEAYYFRSKSIITKDESKECKKLYNDTIIEGTYDPFPFMAFGAYVPRNELIRSLMVIAQEEVEFDDKPIKYIQDLNDYFKIYSKGFFEGYESFENKIEKQCGIFNDVESKARGVLNYINNHRPYGWFNYRSWILNYSFGMSGRSGTMLMSPENKGIIFGQLYKAWSLIFFNNYIFDPIIQKEVLPEIQLKEKRNPFVNLKAKFAFERYIQSFIVDPYPDHSYLFQRLKKEGLIPDMKHLKFIEWLKEEELISESVYQEFCIQNGFRSLNKSYSTFRENNFNIVFNDIIG